MNNKLTVFLDNIGRTIIGVSVKETDTTISIENPALVHVQPNPQTSHLQLQILPLFFREFLSDRTAPTVWNFNKNAITMSNELSLAEQFTRQYNGLFEVHAAPPQTISEDPEVVKLFDEEK
jgi:hypothetical protein